MQPASQLCFYCVKPAHSETTAGVEKAIAQLKAIVREILKEKMGDEKAAQLAETLATGRWTHDYPLTYEELQDLGLPVSTDMPQDVYSFMELFPQPKQKVPSVQYIPVPARQPVYRDRER